MRAIESANARLAADSVRGAEIKAMLRRHAEATSAHVRATEAVAAAKEAAIRERQTQVGGWMGTNERMNISHFVLHFTLFKWSCFMC